MLLMVENCFPLSFAAFGKGWPQFGCSHGAFDVVVLSPAAPEGKRTIEQAAGYRDSTIACRGLRLSTET